MQKPKEAGGKPVSDQWIPPFVIVDDNGKPVGPVEASSFSYWCLLMVHNTWWQRQMPAIVFCLVGCHPWQP